MKRKTARRRIEVNLEELDRIIDHGTRAPLSESDGQKIKAALHAMADRLTPKRNTEKTSAVLPTPAPKPVARVEGEHSVGHGRNGAAAFAGGTTVTIPHATLQSGNACPECGEGKVYRQKEPATLIRIVGQAPLKATIFEMERLRCNACGQVFTAAEPETAGPDKYDATSMRILHLAREPGDKRTGIFTSGIVSLVGAWRIALFFTGPKHAGENIAEVLKQRARELPAPIQMCDALSRNTPKLAEVTVLVANCLAHGRRQIIEVAENFPQECRHILESLGTVYQNDARARKLSPEERLRFHQEHSGPVMEELQQWMKAQFAEHRTEPNSGLGKAMSYLLNHWAKLTLFLSQPGAPIDNNLVERALKKAILNRRNAFFYKTLNGAHTGDLFMSLIHTCELNGINPFDYLTELRRHAAELSVHPQEWMPWNFRDTLARLTTPSAA
jgi:rubredoxin